jgi:hypothetical protein
VCNLLFTESQTSKNNRKESLIELTRVLYLCPRVADVFPFSDLNVDKLDVEALVVSPDSQTSQLGKRLGL